MWEDVGLIAVLLAGSQHRRWDGLVLRRLRGGEDGYGRVCA